MASGNTLVVWMPYDNEPTATDYATLDTRNGHPVLDFDDTTTERSVFSSILPRTYAGGGITCYISWAATSATATTTTVTWDVAYERIGEGSQDIDSDGFASAATATDAPAPATSGNVDIISVAQSDGAGIDSIAVGEAFRVMVRRVATATGDTVVGDAELVAIELKET